MARKYARIFVRGHYLSREANSFPRAKWRKTVSYEEHKMSKDKYPSIFSRQMATIVYIYRTTSWGYTQFPGNFRSIRFLSRNFQNFRLNGSLLKISTISRFSGNFLRKPPYYDFGNLGRMESAQGQPGGVI